MHSQQEGDGAAHSQQHGHGRGDFEASAKERADKTRRDGGGGGAVAFKGGSGTLGGGTLGGGTAGPSRTLLGESRAYVLGEAPGGGAEASQALGGTDAYRQQMQSKWENEKKLQKR